MCILYFTVFWNEFDEYECLATIEEDQGYTYGDMLYWELPVGGRDVVLGASGKPCIPTNVFFLFGFRDELNRKAPTKAELQNMSFLTFLLKRLVHFTM